MVVSIGGEKHWLWRAVDQHGAHNSHSYSALFAGHTAHLQFQTDGASRLYYLEFRSDRIFHLVEAPRVAPAFVREVWAYMAALIDGGSPDAGRGGQARASPSAIPATPAKAARRAPNRLQRRPTLGRKSGAQPVEERLASDRATETRGPDPGDDSLEMALRARFTT